MAKKTIIAIFGLFLLVCTGLTARENFIGGSASYLFELESMASTEKKSTEISLYPMFGYTQKEGIDLAAEVVLNHRFGFATTFGLSPMIRSTIKNYDKLRIIGVYQAGYAFTFYNNTAHKALQAISIGFYPQIEYRLSDLISFHASFGGLFAEYDFGGISSTSNFKIGANLFTEKLSIGILFHYKTDDSAQPDETK